MSRYDRFAAPRTGRIGGAYGRGIRSGPGSGRPYDRETRRYRTRRYDHAYRGVAPHWGWGPTGWPGWGPGMEFSAFAGVPYYGFDPEEPVRAAPPPRESPTYGWAGDRAARRWARHAGYDASHPIQSSPRGRR